MKLLPTLAFSLLSPPLILSAVAQQVQSAQSPAITFHSSSNLVLVDVFASNVKNGLPDQDLKREDFQVLDNGHPIAVKTFDTGTRTRPLALWLVVQCDMTGWEREGSGLFRGQIKLFTPALKDLGQDKVAVAHWCDNGDSQIDLRPSSSVEQAASTLEQVLAKVPDMSHGRTGELALQKTLQSIVDATHSEAPPGDGELLPVVIFLYGDYSGMPRDEADHFINELLQTSAVAFGLKDRRSPKVLSLGEQGAVAHYIAAQTGGEYLSVTPETYATALEEILRQLHFRYELGFKPEVLDGTRHKLTVKLVCIAKKQHKNVRLRYRAAYVPVPAR
jgi:hypothetical protein